MSEREMDWACGFYDELHQKLYDGDLTKADIEELHKNYKITDYQYNFAIDYLKGE